jgi:hypothetical protein
MSYKVIQWATGNVGKHALRALIEHPDYELVGLWVHSPEKAGKDAGELAGLGPIGVIATNSVEDILRIQADCVSYMANADLRPADAIADMARCLESGKNVVSTSVPFLTYPKTAPHALIEPLEAACKKGGTSCFTSAIDPGFANDLIPLVLMGVCERVESVRILEILNYSTYDNATTLFDIMGFGKPLDQTPLLLRRGNLKFAWACVVEMMADALDVQLDEVREVYERAAAERSFDVALGTITAGTAAGLRFEVQGIVRGRPAIVVEHVTRMHDDIAPQWPRGHGSGSYRVVIKGSPALTCDFYLRGADGDHNTGGLCASAMRVLNAIPAVCAANPGLLSTLDLPIFSARHVMR